MSGKMSKELYNVLFETTAAAARPPKKSKTEDGDEARVMVEFKFKSCKTRELDDGEMEGTLHVPMLQDNTTGHLRIPEGRTEVEGKTKLYGREELFTGVFERPTADAPIENFHLGFHLQISFSGQTNTRLVNSHNLLEEDLEIANYEFQTYSSKPTESKLCQGRLDEWERDCGGMLFFFAKGRLHKKTEHDDYPRGDGIDGVTAMKLVQNSCWIADYKLKINTTLSAHAPNEAALKMEEGAVPNWNALVKLVEARFPGQDPAWAREAVDNYKHFCDLKKDAKDWKSVMFFPSKAIDMVWIAHRSFPMRYQHDMLACCGHIIEPTLFLGQEAERLHGVAFEKHVAKAKTFVPAEECGHGLNKKDFYNREFWPMPKKVGAQHAVVHDYDSDDHCHFNKNWYGI